MGNYSDILFAQPSFLSGIASVLDIGGTFSVYNEKPTEQQADMIALKSDWLAVVQDLQRAVEEYAR